MLIPSLLEIESVHGYCNANCTMCSIRDLSTKKHIMPNTTFEDILGRFTKYLKGKPISLDIVGMGESLLDDGIFDKITIAKKMGFSNICMPSNAGLLDTANARSLLDSGLEILLCGIDSLKKPVYEEIRTNLVFEKVMENIHGFISMRDRGGYRTKIYLRVIEQEFNTNEWPEYTAYWAKYLDFEKGDMILSFPVHNWADEKGVIEKDIQCNYIFDRMVIDYRGMVQFCCIDVNADFYDLGNVLENDPLHIFNNTIFNKSRGIMEDGKINILKYCKKCDVPLKRLNRTYFKQ